VTSHYILTDYLQLALDQAVFESLEDGSFSGRIPSCVGVIAFEKTRGECEQELRSVLEEWLVLGLKLGHRLPVLGDIDLNRDPNHEPVDAL
jgi:predicted RNase H-like HicB family nuclease